MSGACTLQVGVVERPRRHFEGPAELARWDALAHWAAGPNPFHECWYLLPALRAFDPAGEVTLLCLEADGQLRDTLALVFGEACRAAATVMREERAMLRQPEDSCAAMDHPMIGHFWRERRTIAGHNIAVGGAARRLPFRAIAAKETGSLPRVIS